MRENYGKLIDICEDIKPCLTSSQRMFLDNTRDGGDFKEGEMVSGHSIALARFSHNTGGCLRGRHSSLFCLCSRQLKVKHW